MLRKTLITFGVVIALLPYLGFPHSWQTIVSTTLGTLIVLLLLASRRKTDHVRIEGDMTPARTLHVERMEIEERPEMHVERETVVDTAQEQSKHDEVTTVEREVTTVRRRRKAPKVISNENSEVRSAP